MHKFRHEYVLLVRPRNCEVFALPRASALVCSSLECFGAAFDAVDEAALNLDRQLTDDLVDALDRWFVINVPSRLSRFNEVPPVYVRVEWNMRGPWMSGVPVRERGVGVRRGS